jgi:hypothetical protein
MTSLERQNREKKTRAQPNYVLLDLAKGGEASAILVQKLNDRQLQVRNFNLKGGANNFERSLPGNRFNLIG